MVLVPDERHREVWEGEISDGVGEGDMLLFGHGFSIHYGEIEPPAGVDVALVAPKGPGHLVRRTYTEGGGVPKARAPRRSSPSIRTPPATLARSRSPTRRGSAAPAVA